MRYSTNKHEKHMTAKASEKVLVYTIEYRVDADASNDMNEILGVMNEYGSAEVVDVSIETKKEE